MVKRVLFFLDADCKGLGSAEDVDTASSSDDEENREVPLQVRIAKPDLTMLQIKQRIADAWNAYSKLHLDAEHHVGSDAVHIFKRFTAEEIQAPNGGVGKDYLKYKEYRISIDTVEEMLSERQANEVLAALETIIECPRWEMKFHQEEYQEFKMITRKIVKAHTIHKCVRSAKAIFKKCTDEEKGPDTDSEDDDGPHDEVHGGAHECDDVPVDPVEGDAAPDESSNFDDDEPSTEVKMVEWLFKTCCGDGIICDIAVELTKKLEAGGILKKLQKFLEGDFAFVADMAVAAANAARSALDLLDSLKLVDSVKAQIEECKRLIRTKLLALISGVEALVLVTKRLQAEFSKIPVGEPAQVMFRRQRLVAQYESTRRMIHAGCKSLIGFYKTQLDVLQREKKRIDDMREQKKQDMVMDGLSMACDVALFFTGNGWTRAASVISGVANGGALMMDMHVFFVTLPEALAEMEKMEDKMKLGEEHAEELKKIMENPVNWLTSDALVLQLEVNRHLLDLLRSRRHLINDLINFGGSAPHPLDGFPNDEQGFYDAIRSQHMKLNRDMHGDIQPIQVNAESLLKTLDAVKPAARTSA